jgi:putative YhbY family RNA-binding protein
VIVLTPAQVRELRARAHHLDPVVIIGQHGLTPSVLREIDVNLRAHELIKVRVVEGSREERDASLERICAALGAAPVQHIGKLLVIWRPKPQPETSPPASPVPSTSPASRRRRAAGSAPRTGAHTMAKSTPQARRPRSPLPRGDNRGQPRGRGDSRAAPRARGATSAAPRGTSSRLAPASGRTPSAQARRRRRGGA